MTLTLRSITGGYLAPALINANNADIEAAVNSLIGGVAGGLPTTGGTITGNLEITGTLLVDGASTFVGNITAGILTLSGALSGVGASFSTLALSGALSTSYSGAFLTRTGVSTAAQYLQIANTGGSFIFGIEGASPGTLSSSAQAYGGVFVNTNGLYFSGGGSAVFDLHNNTATFRSGVAITQSSNNTTALQVSNTNVGAAANSRFILSSDTAQLSAYAYSSLYPGTLGGINLAGLTLFTLESNTTGLMFANQGNNNPMYFTIGSTVRAQVTNSGMLVNGLLDLSSASGGQIAFPATQNASSDANTLDDYEEGTWTPSLGGNTTYTTQTGMYTKIGRTCHVNCNLTVNVLGTGSVSDASGLPFTVLTQYGIGAVRFTSVGSSFVNLQVSAISGGTTLSFGGATAAASNNTAATTVFANSAVARTSVTYFV